MKHRRGDVDGWPLEAIDSVFERGDPADWRRLFAAARGDASTASGGERVARARRSAPRAALALELIRRLCSPRRRGIGSGRLNGARPAPSPLVYCSTRPS